MKKGFAKKLIASLLAALMVVGFVLPAGVLAEGDFVVDWDNYDGMMTGSDNLQKWAVAKGDGGYYFYVEVPQYNGGPIVIDYANVQVDVKYSEVRYYGWNSENVLDRNNAPIAGGSVKSVTDANGWHAELFVPDSYFAEEDFTLSSGGNSIASADIPTVDEVNGTTEPTEEPSPEVTPTTEPTEEPSPEVTPTTEPTEEPSPEVTPTTNPTADPTTKPGGEAYTGIVIDGEFDDWAGVPEYPIDEGKDYDTVDGVSVVWDGDWVYIYLMTESDDYGAVTGAGGWSNGQYVITTDLGNQLLVQVKRDGSIGGVTGATAKADVEFGVGAAPGSGPHYWEIAIPASELPEYSESFSFGLYQGATIIPVVKDIQGSTGGEFGENIVIDGKYDDWDYYPHTTIEYATGGTQEKMMDAKGALWSNDGTLYGHVETSMPAHLDSKGGCFLGNISIAFNGDKDYKDTPDKGNLYPKLMDENGRVYGAGDRLEPGIHTFYIYDTRFDNFGGRQDENGNWYSPNLEQVLTEALGTMKVTVKDDGTHECEFELDLEKVAEFIGCDPEDFKQMEARFGELGDEWFGTAGTPTGAWLGVGLCIATVGGVFVADKRNKKKELKTK